MQYIAVPKIIEEARLHQASKAPEPSSTLWLGAASIATPHAASKVTGIVGSVSKSLF